MDLVNLISTYKELGIADVIDHERFNLISIDHHSTKIEGSTLTEYETQVLIDEGITPHGKPINDTFMVTDHHAALLFTLENAKEKRSLTVMLLQSINSIVLRNTGQTFDTILGKIDARTGAFRRGNVSAGVSYFPNYDKIEPLTKDLIKQLDGAMQKKPSIQEQIRLSFDAHFNLVSIHPWYDGNGRTSRLLMNYIQAYYGLPLAIVKNENKAAYIEALVETRKQENIQVFRDFMAEEYRQMLEEEIAKFREMQKPEKGRGFSFLF
jgi:Fic family protein